jgi:cardiolipin synthase
MTLPNLLTLLRVAAIPLIVAGIVVPASIAGKDLRLVAALLFVAASATDWLDGYLARRLHQMSALGRMMDPVADKMLVASVLVALSASGELTGWDVVPTLIIIARELLVSGLREALASYTVALPVTFLAKIKTTVQLVALILLIGAPVTMPAIVDLGLAALWLAAALTLVTGLQYLAAGVRHLDAARPGE